MEDTKTSPRKTLDNMIWGYRDLTYLTEDVDILLNISCLVSSAGKLGFLEYPVSWELLEAGAEEMEEMEEEDGVADPALVLGVMIGAVVGSAILLFNLTVCLFLVEVQTNCGKKLRVPDIETYLFH